MKYGTIIYIIFLFLSFNYNCSDAPKVGKVIFEREKELIEVCSMYNIPTQNTSIILMPPTKCRSCQVNALRILDSIPNAYIMYDKNDFCEAKYNTQKCIPYIDNEISKRGLVKFYSALLVIQEGKVIEYRILIK